MADSEVDQMSEVSSPSEVTMDSTEVLVTASPVETPATDPSSEAEKAGEEAKSASLEASAAAPASSSGGFCCSFVANMNPRARDLIYWKDPVQSGIFLGVSTVALLAMRCNGLVNTVSFVGLIVLSLSFAITAVSALAKKFLGKDLPNPLARVLSQPITLSDDQVEGFSRCLAAKFDKSCQELRRLYCIVDISDSFQFGIALWLVYWITSRIGFFDLLLVAVILLFAVPKLYEVYQVQIDQAVAKGKAQTVQLLEKAKAVPYVDQVAKILSPKEKTQ
ncbi:reticulon-1-A-like [Sycon ciliatum]|uniref:reticulon-1-A-like n=1 Tax=Sycon ciliatum TaxID=27933 RepID=UPI0020A8AFFC|eukprot:scpid20649/ scgid13473/ Reticulon-3-B; RTN3.2